MDYWLFGTVQAQVDQATALAQAAEKLGYAGIALPDHVVIPKQHASEHPSKGDTPPWNAHFPDALVTLSAMAAATTTLKLMTYVYVLPMRDPFSAAKQAGTLAMLSKYRLTFGVGAGWLKEEIELLGHDPHTRGRRLDEMIHIMRDLWDDGVASHDSDLYRFGPVGQFPVPKRRIPILIGGKTPAALQRAARNDGWLGMNYSMEEIASLLKTLRMERQRHLDSSSGDDRSGLPPFQTMVIPNAMPAPEVYRQLEDYGATGTLAVPWDMSDPKNDALEPKIEAMQAFADRFIKRASAPVTP